jgi:ABC-type uncharacterized transport system involved in gliding motility auxiliary subunit
MASPNKKLDKRKTGLNAIFFTLLVIVAIVAFNLILSRQAARWDLTQDKVYTLSKASKDLVAALPDRMTVKAFISNDLQPPYSQTAKYIRDLLDEYAAASKGKLVWEAIDPSGDPKLEEEAQKFKVDKQNLGLISSNKFEIGAKYLGIAFQYQGNIESIPQIRATEGLEYAISRTIKLLSSKKKKIGFAASEGELSLTGDPSGQHGPGGLGIIKQSVDEFELVPVMLNTGEKPIADDIDALIIAGPKQEFSERAKFVVDQFLMKGKSVAFFVDGMVVEAPRQMQIPGVEQSPSIGRKNDVGLEPLLEHYGFRIKDDIVMEPRQMAPALVVVGGMGFPRHHPAFVLATDVAKANPLMSDLNGMILPLASSVEQVKDKQPGLQVTELVASTPDAWHQTGFFVFDPRARLEPPKERARYVLGFYGKGKLTSFWADKPTYPNDKGEQVPMPAAASSAPGSDNAPLKESTGEPRLVVIGDSDFVSDEYLRLSRYIPDYQANAIFMFNLLGHLGGDEALKALHNKGMKSRPLTLGSESTPTVVKVANVLGVPLAFLLFGILRWRVRSARRRAAKL